MIFIHSSAQSTELREETAADIRGRASLLKVRDEHYRWETLGRKGKELVLTNLHLALETGCGLPSCSVKFYGARSRSVSLVKPLGVHEKVSDINSDKFLPILERPPFLNPLDPHRPPPCPATSLSILDFPPQHPERFRC